jgi:hypothetical protein
MLLERLKKTLRQATHLYRELDEEIPGKMRDRLEMWKNDPATLMSDAGFEPDPWQAELLRSKEDRIMICAARQVGKSRGVSFLALSTALSVPGSTTLIIAPVAEQSNELMAKVIESYHALGDPIPVRREAVTRLELSNRSRVIALPGKERRMRSYTANLLLIDEAARVPDDVMNAVSPTMAVNKGRMVALSTAFAKSGWFYEGWHNGDYKRLKVKATECPRIPKEFLAQERRTLGKRWFEMEYEGEFQDAIGALFATDDIRAMRDYSVETLFGAGAFGWNSESAIDDSVKPLFA